MFVIWMRTTNLNKEEPWSHLIKITNRIVNRNLYGRRRNLFSIDFVYVKRKGGYLLTKKNNRKGVLTVMVTVTSLNFKHSVGMEGKEVKNF